MAKATVYRVEGNEVCTLKELAELLGVTKITNKDIKEGKYPIVEVVEIIDDTPVDEALTNMEDVVDQETVDEDADELVDDDPEEKLEEVTEEDIEFPEVGSFKDKKALQKYYKKLTTAHLEQWVELEGIQSNVKPTDHEGIYRMRLAMAILYLHFPKQSTKKSKSKYAKYSTEQLVEMATKAGLEIKDSKGDNRILRMYAIMTLRNAGLLA